MNRAALIFFTLLASFATPALAAQSAFPAKAEANGTTLVLNGQGPRLYGFFRVTVYRAALYLPKRNTTAKQILNVDAPRMIRMHYLHDVSADDVRKAWRAYLHKNCTGHCHWPAPGVDAFLALVGAVHAGDNQTYVFVPGRVDFSVNGVKIGHVQAAGFPALLLSTWIGAVPTTQQLKQDLLGGDSGG
ncbi:MAG: chalcone isomerase family protein [Gammaproteobacteria bacterium]